MSEKYELLPFFTTFLLMFIAKRWKDLTLTRAGKVFAPTVTVLQKPPEYSFGFSCMLAHWSLVHLYIYKGPVLKSSCIIEQNWHKRNLYLAFIC